MLKMVDGTGIIGLDMICPLGVSTPQPPNYDRVELEGAGMLVLPNSLDAPLDRLELGGKTEQVQTSGKQLFDAKNAELNKWVDSTEIIATVGRNCIFRLNVKPNTIYQVNTLSASCTFAFSQFSKENVFLKQTVFSKGTKSFKCTTTENVDYAYFLIGDTVDNINGIINDVMLYEGEEYKNYEPYTGGKPSPSPEYPQEIKNVGKWNEETQKYEVDVKITGKNLFDREKAKDNSNWIFKDGDGYAKFPIYVKKGNKITFSYTEKLTTGKNFYLGIAQSEAGSVVAWLYHSANLSISNNKYTIVAVGDYMYLMCNGSNIQTFLDVIQTLQVEISPTQTDYAPYTEQTLTLTSDRPITKWDRLVEQGGQIGWLYKSTFINGFNGDGYTIRITGNVGSVSRYIITFPDALIKGNASADIYVDKYRGVNVSYTKEEYGICCNWNDGTKYFNAPNENVKTLDDFKNWLTENPLTIAYETEDTTFIPLPLSEQNAIRALKTYYPTTVITADGGELAPDIKVTYRKEI